MPRLILVNTDTKDIKMNMIIVSIEESNFEIKSEDQDFINKLEDIFGAGTVSGYNPFDYWEQGQ